MDGAFEVVHCEARVDDVFHKNHVAVFNRAGEIQSHFHFSRRRCVAMIAGNSKEFASDVAINVADQVRIKHERALKNANSDNLFAFEFLRKFRGDFFHLFLDLFFSDVRFKRESCHRFGPFTRS
ncbi:hypothetical protein D3C87_1695700 [compost metagenome]